ncbi:hypothetical protein B0I31_10494 [Saccharothrix carnea]|uniref:Secreted protein n=1 Tax=Saccharothrix carnea TaxID=1280637 RepID=A0A2P8IBH8_SACCR|nr:hypothetical protein [Saccharothrix carnea]PSL55803.1 hypothetical protein B0I31_10494 [Saccharothrix carnea]
MKRLVATCCAVVLALLGASGAATAAAAPRADIAAAPNCQHGSTYGIVVSAAHVTRYDGVELGAIQLCRDTSSNYWAFVLFYGPVPTGNWGYAYLNRFLDGQPVDTFGCNPGGNGYVEPRQTKCWTPKISAPSSRVTFLASGVQCEGSFPTCNFMLGEGYTARMR